MSTWTFGVSPFHIFHIIFMSCSHFCEICHFFLVNTGWMHQRKYKFRHQRSWPQTPKNMNRGSCLSNSGMQARHALVRMSFWKNSRCLHMRPINLTWHRLAPGRSKKCKPQAVSLPFFFVSLVFAFALSVTALVAVHKRFASGPHFAYHSCCSATCFINGTSKFPTYGLKWEFVCSNILLSLMLSDV